MAQLTNEDAKAATDSNVHETSGQLDSTHRKANTAYSSSSSSSSFTTIAAISNIEDVEKGSLKSHLDNKDVAVDPSTDPAPPYSIFIGRQRTFIIFITALTTLLPPLNASILYPVTTLLSRDLHVSITDINLTITVYLVVQGIAPSFAGSLADIKGRRPVLLIAWAIFITGSVGVAAPITSSYGLLFAMRCLQSIGGSGTVPLSLATVSDLVTSAERGKYTSYVQMGFMLGPSLGPVIGGSVSKYLGWQAIFWVLALYAATIWLVVFFFLPETSRNIVGNGSVPPPSKWNATGRSLILSLVSRPKPGEPGKAATPATKESSLSGINPLRSLQLFTDKQSCLLLIYSGFVYASTYMLLATLPDQLERIYHLDTLMISLCFLVSGLGTVTSTLLTGRIIDYNFSRHARRAGTPVSKNKQQDALLSSRDFPLERARLETTIIGLLFTSVSMLCYGWTLQSQKTHIAVPLTFLFFTSFGTLCSFAGMNNLIMDLNRDKSGVASAAMNITRCWLGAAGTAFATPLAATRGIGWLCVVIPGIWILFSPMLIIVLRYGPRWREEKQKTKAAKEKVMKENSETAVIAGIPAVAEVGKGKSSD